VNQFFNLAQSHEERALFCVLMRVTGWIAAARIAYQAGQYVVDKRSCVARYRDAIGDEWTDLLVTIDQRCRQDWRYPIPDNHKEQEELQVIGCHILAYENQFLKLYDRFLLAIIVGANVPQQYITFGIIDEILIHHTSILSGLDAQRLFLMADAGA
jgi:hypothetical protein